MASITITLNDIQTPDDLRAALTALGFEFNTPAIVPAAAPAEAEDYFPPSEDLRAEINAAEARKATKTRGRPKKKDTPPELEGQQWMPFPEDTTTLAPEKAETVEATPTAEAKELTLDDAKDKGRLLLVAKGADALRKLLDEYGLRKVGDLPKEKFASFMTDCDKLMKG